jgi:hypothetical protein
MTVDASRSCLGLSTSTGSAVRHIVDARVLLITTHRMLHWQLPVIGSLMNPNSRIRGFGVRRVLRDVRNLSAERANPGAHWKVRKFPVVGLRPVFFLLLV